MQPSEDEAPAQLPEDEAPTEESGPPPSAAAGAGAAAAAAVSIKPLDEAPPKSALKLPLARRLSRGKRALELHI